MDMMMADNIVLACQSDVPSEMLRSASKLECGRGGRTSRLEPFGHFLCIVQLIWHVDGAAWTFGPIWVFGMSFINET
jgi:hypothetical protein